MTNDSPSGTERGGFAGLLRAFDARSRTTEALESSFRLLALGTLLVAGFLGLLWLTGRSVPFPSWTLAPLLLAFVPWLQRLFGGQHLLETASKLDREQGLDDLLKTALALETTPERQPLEELTLSKGSSALNETLPKSVLPWQFPQGPVTLSCLAPLLVLLVAFSHRPGAEEFLAALGAPIASDDLAEAAVETEDRKSALEEGDVPEPDTPEPTAVPRIPLDGELTELSELAQMGEQIDIPDSLELSDSSTLTEATAQELQEMLEDASKTLGDELIEEESRRQEEAGAEPGDGEGSEGGPLEEKRVAPEGDQEGAPAGEDGSAQESQEGQEAGAEASESPSPTKPKMEQSQSDSQAGEQMAAKDLAGKAAEAEPTAGQPSEGEAAGSFGDSTAPQSEEVTPFGEATELPVTLEVAILEAQKQEEKVEGEKRERASEAQESTVRFTNVRTPSEVSTANAVVKEPISWLHRDLVRDYFLKLDDVLEAEAERERAAAEERSAGPQSIADPRPSPATPTDPARATITAGPKNQTNPVSPEPLSPESLSPEGEQP